MRHVFVETNWLVDCFAPAHFKQPDALDLLTQVRENKLKLYLPASCLVEARPVIRAKFQPKQVDAVREHLRWRKASGNIAVDDEAKVRTVLDQYEAFVRKDLDRLELSLDELRNIPNVEIFSMTDRMLEKSITLSLEKLELKPFDSAILAAILVKAGELRGANETDLVFCELDSDLQPWDKLGNPKPVLKALYDEAILWVYSDFLMNSPERPNEWPAIKAIPS